MAVRGLFKIVDISDSDDEYSPVVRGHGVNPWERELLEEQVAARQFTDERLLVVRELSGDEYLAVLTKPLEKQYANTDIDLLLRDDGCSCLASTAGECDYECAETGDCSGACEVQPYDCTCPDPEDRDVNPRLAALYSTVAISYHSELLRQEMRERGLV